MAKRISVRLVKTECACESCQSACEKTPGWFRPGEAEKAAKLMGLSLPVFFKRYLGVNWWEDSGNDVFALAPALVGEKPGREYPGSPLGTCVFFQRGKCRIHAEKPWDCSHGNPHEHATTPGRDVALVRARERTVGMWRKHQGQIEKLLGRKPVAEPFSFFDLIRSI